MIDDVSLYLLYRAHRREWSERPHRCRVIDCTGLQGRPTSGLDIWIRQPYESYAARGYAAQQEPGRWQRLVELFAWGR